MNGVWKMVFFYLFPDPKYEINLHLLPHVGFVPFHSLPLQTMVSSPDSMTAPPSQRNLYTAPSSNLRDSP